MAKKEATTANKMALFDAARNEKFDALDALLAVTSFFYLIIFCESRKVRGGVPGGGTGGPRGGYGGPS